MPRYSDPSLRRRSREPISAWRWWSVGLIMGAGVSTGFFLSPLPLQWGLIKLPDPETLAQQAAAEPAPLAQKPRFDFYTILPEMEVMVPEEEENTQRAARVITPVDAAAPTTTTPPYADSGEQYWLQFGSFKTFHEAQQLQARLTQQAVTTDIQSVTLQNEAWYRVRSASFAQLNDAEQEKQRLEQLGTSSILLKFKANDR